MTEIERCDTAIEEIEQQLRDGHPQVEGLCLALADWSAELRVIHRQKAEKSAAGEATPEGDRSSFSEIATLRQPTTADPSAGGAEICRDAVARAN